MPINIEITASPDFSLLSEIHRLCFARAWDTQAFKDIFSVGHTLALIAKGAAGFAVCRVLREEAEIITLGVPPEFRRAGVGNAIVSALLEEARGQGVRNVFLEVGGNNVAARALYSKHGFTVISQRKQYYNHEDGFAETAIVMRKEV